MTGFSNWKINESGCLVGLEIDGNRVLSQEGIEFSDGNVHFKHHPAQRSTARVVVKKCEMKKNKLDAELDVFLSQTRCTVSIHQTFSPKLISRDMEIVVHEGGYFEDFALRNSFFKEFFDRGYIAGKNISFDRLDRNHQFETNEARLLGPHYTVRIAFSADAPASFAKTMYIRSSRDGTWWVHSRLFPKLSNDTILRLCRPFWDKEVPFTRWLMRIKPVRDYFWHVGERPEMMGRKTFGLVALGRVYLSPGTRIQMGEKMYYEKVKA